MCCRRWDVDGLCGCDFLLGLQPSLELQLHLGSWFHRTCARFFLDVEPFDLDWRFDSIWNLVAALTQPTNVAPRRYVQVHLEDSSLWHHLGRSAAHVYEVVPDQVGRGNARSAWTTVCKRLICQEHFFPKHQNYSIETIYLFETTCCCSTTR